MKWAIWSCIALLVFAAISSANHPSDRLADTPQTVVQPHDQAWYIAHQREQREAAETARKATPLGHIVFTFKSWRRGGFDNIGLVSFAIANTNSFAMKDFVIMCDWSGQSGTKLGESRQTAFQLLRPGESKTLKEFNMGFINSQTASAACDLEDAVKAE